MVYTYEYPRPAMTADILLFHRQEGKMKVLLVQRKHPPFKGKWALPGGFMNIDETLHAAALRELKEETGIEQMDLQPFRVFDEPGRDPRGRTVTLVFYGFTDSIPENAIAGDDAASLDWFEVDDLPELGFDHEKIIAEFRIWNGMNMEHE